MRYPNVPRDPQIQLDYMRKKIMAAKMDLVHLEEEYEQLLLQFVVRKLWEKDDKLDILSHELKSYTNKQIDETLQKKFEEHL